MAKATITLSDKKSGAVRVSAEFGRRPGSGARAQRSAMRILELIFAIGGDKGTLKVNGKKVPA